MDRITEEIKQKAKKIEWLLTDNDGVLTDTGVYYSAEGEQLKRFSIRDGMGVARLRTLVNVETGIITGENSIPVKIRAQKLNITEVHLGVKDKLEKLKEIIVKKNISYEHIAYIGDDTNDLDVLKNVGLSACPSDAISFVKNEVDYICDLGGGHGAFREFAELIIFAKQN